MLDESIGWAVKEEELNEKLSNAQTVKGVDVKALAIINPGECPMYLSSLVVRFTGFSCIAFLHC